MRIRRSPRREQPDVAPAADMRRDALAGFVELHRHAAGDEMRGGGKADRPGADDRDGQL